MISKRSSSHLYSLFNNKIMPSSKRSQSEVISTILLILITISAIAIISPIVFNLIKNQMKKSQCFDFKDSIKIMNNPTYTCYNNSDKKLRVQIFMGKIHGKINSFFIYVQGDTTKAVEIINNTPLGEVSMYKSSSPVIFPGEEEEITYVIDGINSKPNKIEISIKLNDSQTCGAIDSINNVGICE